LIPVHQLCFAIDSLIGVDCLGIRKQAIQVALLIFSPVAMEYCPRIGISGEILLPRVLLKHMINREVINSVVISTNNA
jgi:hypothetical protein